MEQIRIELIAKHSIMKLSKNETIPDENYQELKKLCTKLSKFTDDRTFKNKMVLKFLRDTD